jgi:cell division protein FtsZ
MGKAMMGTGEAEGEDRATRAAESAISNPLLEEASMKGAKAVLINITGGMDMTLFEVDEAANRIRKEVGEEEANIIFGSSISEEMDGKIRVSVVATGMEANAAAKPRPTLVTVGGAPMARPVPQPMPQPGAQPATAASGVAIAGAGPVPQRAAAQPTMSAAPQPAFHTAGATALAAQIEPVVAPAEPAPAPAAEPAAQAAPLFAPLAAEPQPEPPGPAPTAADRRPSLFRRVTNQLMQRDLDPPAQPRQAPTLGAGEPPVAPRPAAASMAPPAMSAEPAPRPAARAMPAEDLGLEIPAFLRRQAN